MSEQAPIAGKVVGTKCGHCVIPFGWNDGWATCPSCLVRQRWDSRVCKLEPTKKSVPMSEFLEKLAGRTSSIEGNLCVREPFGCGKPITGFRDELSAKEYTISGLCQACQDSVFGR